MSADEFNLVVRQYAAEQHPEWADVGVTFRDADGCVLGYLLVEPGRVTRLCPAEAAQAPPCGAPVP